MRRGGAGRGGAERGGAERGGADRGGVERGGTEIGGAGRGGAGRGGVVELISGSPPSSPESDVVGTVPVQRSTFQFSDSEEEEVSFNHLNC